MGRSLREYWEAELAESFCTETESLSRIKVPSCSFSKADNRFTNKYILPDSIPSVSPGYANLCHGQDCGSSCDDVTQNFS